MIALTGRCLCGSLSYQTRGSPFLSVYCHCESCRRATASPVTGLFCMNRGQVTWEGERRYHRSSPGVTRGFCGTCGTAMHYMTTRWPGEIHLYAATLDDPALFTPSAHMHWADRVPWLQIADTLPKHPRALP